MKTLFISVFLLVVTQTVSNAQSDTIHKTFFEPSKTLNKKRLWAFSGIAAASYTTTIVGLSQYWYKQYNRSSFHFFNDNKEWLQIDKIGHSWTAYTESKYAGQLLKWTGVRPKKAAIAGSAMGSAFQLGIEVLDGFSSKWGASWGDIIGNASGSLLYVGQELIWGEQRVTLKFSSHKVNYNQFTPQVQQRAKNLFGTSTSELILKDYNGQSYWLSTNIASFLPSSTKFPKWLNLAFGYGIENIFGGFENQWLNSEQQVVNYKHIPRQRQYYLSLDVDLSKIKTRSPFLKTLFYAINVIKIPAPALEFNSQNKQLKFYPLYR